MEPDRLRAEPGPAVANRWRFLVAVHLREIRRVVLRGEFDIAGIALPERSIPAHPAHFVVLGIEPLVIDTAARHGIIFDDELREAVIAAQHSDADKRVFDAEPRRLQHAIRFGREQVRVHAGRIDTIENLVAVGQNGKFAGPGRRLGQAAPTPDPDTVILAAEIPLPAKVRLIELRALADPGANPLGPRPPALLKSLALEILEREPGSE